MSTSNSLALPVELIQEVIQSLVVPANPLQYGHGKDVVHTLRQLCLVNHFVYHISVSRLYSSIVLTDGYQLMGLISTLKSSPAICGHIHALFLDSFIIRSSLIPEAGQLLDLLSPHLRRLALCAPGSMFKTSNPMRQVLGRLTHLEDFVRVGFPSAELGDIWSDWKSLRRVLLVGIQVNKSFIDAIEHLPHLTQLWLIDACWGEMIDEYGLMLELLKAGSSFQKVVLVFGSSKELGQFLQFMRGLPEENLKSFFREGLDVQYCELQATVGALRTQVADGTFWELNTHSILPSGTGNNLASPFI